MAVTVPSEEKIYTTVYDNFKGVDYTNDPSNVWKRRSPDGLNMLPDLDGRPYKRYGWKIEVPASEFGEDVKPERLHHFSLNGLEYIMIFNDKGVFYMKTGQDGVVKCQLTDGSTQSTFPPQVDGKNIPADSNRSFYFEGAGLAGFYTFVGNELFRFDGEYYNAVQPHIPIIIEGADHTGSGTDGEKINLLTEYRTVSYMGDGEDKYSLPENPDASKLYVKMYNVRDSDWETVDPSQYTVSDNVVDFNTAPPVSTTDNVRITYVPASGGTNYVIDSNFITDEVSITATRKVVQTRTKTVKVTRQNKKGGIETRTETVGNWSVPTITDTSTSSEIPVPNNYGTATVQDNLTGTWAASGSRVLATKGSYSDAIKVSAANSIAQTYGTSSTSTGGYVQKAQFIKRASTTTTKTTIYTQTKTVTYSKTFKVRVAYPKYKITGVTACTGESRTAFMTCRKALNFGNGLYNQMFLSSASAPNYQTRAWFCEKNDPSYFPDLNYIEVGSDDTEIVGMIKVGSYLGFVKAGSGTDSSIYFAYPTTFDGSDTYAVKQGVNGIGAISNGAFNILEGEPLFLSKDGVVGIEVSDEETDRRARNRSWFLNGKLCKEKLSSAVSYVYDGMYWLAVDGRCYVLDGSQKNSWANEKTNMQYEGYYLENIPALCFASMDEILYFTNSDGSICRFKDSTDESPYTDGYNISLPILEYEDLDIYDDEDNKDIEKMKAYIGSQVAIHGSTQEIMDIEVDVPASSSSGTYTIQLNSPKSDTAITLHLMYDGVPTPTYYDIEFTSGQAATKKITNPAATTRPRAIYDGEATITIDNTDPANLRTYRVLNVEYTRDTGTEEAVDYITGVNEEAKEFETIIGVPILARWSTIADDDGAVHFFKNLQKKGCVVSLLPMPVTGATVSLKADEKEPVEIGQVEFNGGTLPHEFYIKKKLKKYKRLQIICENNDPNSGFGLDQIIKSYTMGNYSKNKG